MNCPMVIDHLDNNCTLVATREVTGRADEEIITTFLGLGYRPNQGTNCYTYRKAVELLGFRTETVDIGRRQENGKRFGLVQDRVFGIRTDIWRNNLTVGQFCGKYPEGTYVVADRGHCFVIRDGRVVDPNMGNRRRGRRRIRNAFRVVSPAPSRVFRDDLRLRRNEDPVVRFVNAPSGKKAMSPAWNREQDALWWLQKNAGARPGVGCVFRLSDLTKNTRYTRGDASRDLVIGRLARVDIDPATV